MYYPNEGEIHKALKAIKETGGFPGKLSPFVRANINGKWATVEVSPYTGMDIQWHLTSEGKKQLKYLNIRERADVKYNKPIRSNHVPDAVVPLTVEVLDALKSIRETGDPNTTKLDILARIQREGIHGVKFVKGSGLIHGSLAEHENGVWTLTDAGKHAEAGHIRKDECAQFTGKVK